MVRLGFLDGFRRKKDANKEKPKDAWALEKNAAEEKDIDVRRAVEKFRRWQIGDLIGNRYMVLRILKGGMGVVYICVDQKTMFPLAVKSFQDKYLRDEKARKLFVREADIWTRLEKHRNIVKAYVIDILSGKPYIFMEYVPSSWDGKATLRDYMLSLKVDLTKALNFAVQFCDGMIYAKSVDLGKGKRGIVHRDIKPENIMITPDGILKITDFGLVKAIDEDVEGIAGTPPYMSSEQFIIGILHNEGTAMDTRSDIYSFGVVLYEMFTGEKPFKGPGVEEYARQHMHQKPTPLKQINSNVPKELENIVLRCLEKRPENRYQSFKDLRRALDDVYFEISGKRVNIHAGSPPESWELSNKGISLVNLGRLDEGILILEKAIRLDPNNAETHINLGVAYGDKDWWDEAIAEYSRVIELDQNNAVVHLNLGNAYYEKNLMDKAITEYSRATELDPNNATAHTNLGNAYAKKMWIDKALVEYKRSIELDPNFAPAHFHLACM
jgi:serine/threonine protein kinase